MQANFYLHINQKSATHRGEVDEPVDGGHVGGSKDARASCGDDYKVRGECEEESENPCGVEGLPSHPDGHVGKSNEESCPQQQEAHERTLRLKE